MNKVNPLFNLLFSPCLQSPNHTSIRPAFVPSSHVTLHRRHRDNCKQQCIHSLNHLYSSKTQSLDQIQDDDLVALPIVTPGTSSENPPSLRLCVVRNQQMVFPLVRHQDDVETDLFIDPKHANSNISLQDVQLGHTKQLPYYGVGWYGQRPVPSLGGGPGYGAPADEIWTIEEEMLEKCLEDGVEVPVLDVGLAHGEKAREGALL